MRQQWRTRRARAFCGSEQLSSLDHSLAFGLAGPHVASEAFDGEYVVLNLNTGKYFSLAGGAAAVWGGLAAGMSVDTITSALPADDARRAQVAACVGQFIEHGLIVQQGKAGVADERLAAGVVAAGGDFSVDVFDDMADLFVADPIHDVSPEAGWPHRPGD